jgi:hypothetical protein
MSRLADDGFCPYRGLAHYDEEYAPFFVGREGDVQVVVANLYAAPLTLLYGESGVGKSSVLMAGVVPRLRERPPVAVAVFREWQRPDFAAALDAEVRRALREASPDALELPAGLVLDELLDQGARALGGPVFLIFDQFEEYFLYHAEQVGTSGFEAELARAVNRRGVDANFLVCLREEGLSKLDRFHARIPNLMGNTIRLERLDRPTAKRAITEPLARYTALREAQGRPGVTIESALVETLLSQQVSFEHGGAGDEGRGGGPPRIELPFLQLVLTRLWAAEREAGSAVLREGTLQRLGGANGVVRAHLGAAMARFTTRQRRVAAEMFHYLVTPSRTKIAHTAGDLAGMMEGAPAAEIQALVTALSAQDARILKRIEPLQAGGEDRYEIFHDALAPGVLDWRGRFLAEQRVRRRLGQAAGVFVLLLVVIFAAVEVQRGRLAAREREKDVQLSQQLASAALTQLVHDPALGQQMAEEALLVARTDRAREALLRTTLASRLLRADSVHIYSVRGVAFSGGGDLLVSASQDNDARVWPSRGGPALHLLRHGSWIRRAAFGPGDTLVVTGSDDGTARVWNLRRPARSRVLRAGGVVMDVAFTPDGRSVVTATDNGVRTVWSAATGVPVHARTPERGAVMNTVDVASTGLAASGVNYGTVELWNPASGESVRSIRGNGSVLKVRFSPDGSRIAVVGDRRAQVYRVDEGPAPELTLVGHAGTVFDVAWSRDGRYLATAGRDRTARVWDARTGASLMVLYGHDDWVYGVSFSPDGRTLATASGDGRVRLWRVDNPPARVVAPVGGLPGDRQSGGRSLVIQDGVARLRQAGGAELPLEPVEADSAIAAAFTPDGKWVVVAGARAFTLWPAAGGAMERRASYVDSGAPGAFLSPDGRWLISAREEGGADIYDVQSVRPREQTDAPPGP